MVFEIKTSGRSRRSIMYNEKKVKREIAECLLAANFILDHDRLTPEDKVKRFERLNILNATVPRHTVHITVAFHPDDKPSKETMVAVARDLMQDRGFSRQPHIVYRHDDTVHPHCHIVASRIRPDGSAINYFVTRKRRLSLINTLNRKYHLIARSESQIGKTLSTEPPKRAEYGTASSKRLIAGVLEKVLPVYNFTSLIELNALIRQYNLWADTGQPGSRMHKNNGLVYEILDEEGKPKSQGIKASSFDLNPGLKYLERRFDENRLTSEVALRQMSTRIELALLSKPSGWQQFAAVLQGRGVQPLPYVNPDGLLYGLVYLDHQTRIAAVDSRLGEAFTPRAIALTLGLDQHLKITLPGPGLKHHLHSNSLDHPSQWALSRDLTAAMAILYPPAKNLQTPQLGKRRDLDKDIPR